MVDIRDRIKGGLLGLVLGDVVGVPVEFKSRTYLQNNPVRDLLSYGTHEQPEGTWSDDSSLTLCTVESLLNHGFDFDRMMDNFTRWLQEAKWTATGEVFDVGITTRQALSNFRENNLAIYCGLFDEYSNGNGSLMRILPIAFAVRQLGADERRTISFKASSLTHAHSRSKLACWLYVEIVRNITTGLDKTTAVDQAYTDVSTWCRDNQMLSEFEYLRRCNSRIATVDSESIHSSGYVVHSMEAAIHSFLKHESYLDSILYAVNLGDDTDTVGAITGGLSGSYYGYQTLPEDWLRKILKIDQIEGIVELFRKKYG